MLHAVCGLSLASAQRRTRREPRTPAPVAATPATPSATPEQEAEARAHFGLGRAYYNSGRFADAAREFQLAYEQSHRPALLHNIFLARRDMGDTVAARDALQQYLALDATIEAEERRRLEARLVALNETIARQPPTATATGTAVVATPVPVAAPLATQPEAPAAVTQPSSPVRDSMRRADLTVPAVLLGVGGAFLIGALIENIVMNDAASELDSKCRLGPLSNQCPASLDQRPIVERYELHRGLAWGFAAAGVVGVGVGVTLLIAELSGASAGETPAVTASCGPSGCIANVRLRF